MSRAGILSNRGDAYQTLIAFDWAISVLSSPEYLWIEVDSVDSLVDDVIVGMLDGRTINCQCKKNQVAYGQWSIRDLASELSKAAMLLARDDNSFVRYYSKCPFGDLQRLREIAITQSSESQYYAAVPKDLALPNEILKKILENYIGPYRFLQRIEFCCTRDDGDEERKLRGRLYGIVSRPDLAFSILWATLDRLGARLESAGEKGSASRYRLTKSDLRKLLENAGAMITSPINVESVICDFERMSAIGRTWQREILRKRLARPVFDDILSAIAAGKKCILLSGGPGSGKTCVMLDVQEELEKQARAGNLIIPLFIQSRSFANTSSPGERESIGMPIDWVEKVARLSEVKKVVVCIDSLDVLSIAREHESLSYFFAQIERLKTIPNVTVLASCRKFDRFYDPRMASFTWDSEFECGSLDWYGQIVPILSELGVDEGSLDERTRSLIGNPRDLLFFCEIACTQRNCNFPNALMLAQRFLEKTVRDTPELGNPAIAALESFAIAMLKARSLFLPIQRFGQSSRILAILHSTGIFAEEEQGKLSFGHQSLLDFLAVSKAMREGKKFDAFIAALPEVLFVRPSIRSFLDYLVGGDRKEFRRQVRSVLFGSSAFHIRRLVAEYVAGMDPNEDDWPLLRDLRQNRRDFFQIIYKKSSSLTWNRFWKEHLIPFLMETRDVDGLTAHIYKIEQWMNVDPVSVCDFWLKALTIPWIDTARIAIRLGFIMIHIEECNISCFVPLLKKLLDFPLHQNSQIGIPIARCVNAGLIDDSLLWRYMIRDIEDERDELRIGDKIHCQPDEFERQENGFLVARMKKSTALLDMAIASLEKWSEMQRQKYGVNSSFFYGFGFITETSYRDIHTRHTYSNIDGLNYLLDTMETAILFHAENRTEWWYENRDHLCTSREGALRYFAVIAFTAFPEENVNQIVSVMLDRDFLEHGPAYEIAILIRNSFPYLENAPRKQIMKSILLLHTDCVRDTENCKWSLVARLRMLSAVPCCFRPPEVQKMLDEYERVYGKIVIEPYIESAGGLVAPPFSFKEFLRASVSDIIMLLGHYENYNRHMTDDFLVGGKEEVSDQLHEAASRSPIKFLNLLIERWKDIDKTFRKSILFGLSRNIEYRFGNLTSASPWESVEDTDASELSLGIVRELERHWSEWRYCREAAEAILACSCVVETTDIAERLVILSFDFTTLEEIGTKTGDLMSDGLHMIKGRIAEAMMRLTNRFVENDIPWPYLLESILNRLAGDNHPEVRAMVVHRLPYLISRKPEIGWRLFDSAMRDSDGFWHIAEPCLYYFYHSDYNRIETALDRLRREGSGKDFKSWGRIAALVTLDRLKPFMQMFDELKTIDSDKAWEGAAQVWTNKDNIKSFPDCCIEGLRSGFAVGGVASLMVARAMGHMFHRLSVPIPIPIDLFTNYLETSHGDPARRSPHFFDLTEWFIHLSKNHPDEVLKMALHYAKFNKEKGESIYDYNNQYPRLLTYLFREAEEREVSDNGSMMHSVLELQDILTSIGISSIEEWLRVAERQ